MTISINAEKSFEKNLHPFMTKKKKISTECSRNIPQYRKGHLHEKLTANITLNDVLLEIFPLRSRVRQGYSFSPCFST